MKTIILVALILLSQQLMASDAQIYLAANLSIDGESIVWPIISLPSGKVLSAESSYCDADAISADDISCTLPTNKTLASFGMSRDVRLWFDANGAEHKVKSGYHNTNPLGGVGEELNGFVITDKQAKKTSDGIVRFGGAITSAPGLIATKTERLLEEGDKADVERVLASWRKKYFRECGIWCTKGVNQLARVPALKLQVTEYKLPGGRIFRHFTGRSIRDVKREATTEVGADVLYVIVDFWKYSDADGYIDESRVESTSCETQCLAGWRGSPDVMEYRSTLYILGERWGGTIYGYFLFKVEASTLKFTARLTGGS